MASEEERATEYRRMMTAQVSNKLARERALHGDPVYWKQLKSNFAALIPDAGWDPPPGFVEDER